MYFRSKNVLFILTFGTFRFADYTSAYEYFHEGKYQEKAVK
nr:MAG TPA: Tetratricopeptide repeat [Caudoviricetes sp.]